MPKIKVDLTNVKEQGKFNPKRLEAGDYLATITEVELGESKAGNKQLVFAIQVNDHRTAVYPYYCGLDEKQLWKLRNLLVACGFKAPKKALSIDTDRFVGKQIGIALEDDEYEGKEKSVIDSIFPAAEIADESGPATDDSDDDEDEIPVAAAPVADDEDDDELDLDDIE